jgi:phosphatidylglycerophosphate synthase
MSKGNSANKSAAAATAIRVQSGIPYYLCNIIGYVRFAAILASWKFALTDPYIFTALFAFASLLDAVDGPVARLLNQTSQYGAQLDILMDRFCTESLIFVVLKLGLASIKEEGERNWHGFYFATLFLIDFITYWFLIYSKYLVSDGLKPHRETNVLIQLYNNPVVLFVVSLLSELYVFIFYMQYFPDHFINVLNHNSFNLLVALATGGVIFKNLINLLFLAASSTRIVTLDVDQKNAEISAKLSAAGGKVLKKAK